MVYYNKNAILCKVKCLIYNVSDMSYYIFFVFVIHVFLAILYISNLSTDGQIRLCFKR